VATPQAVTPPEPDLPASNPPFAPHPPAEAANPPGEAEEKRTGPPVGPSPTSADDTT
jgi:hypothetical protein